METLRKKEKKNIEVVWDLAFNQISTNNYYPINANRLKEKLWQQNESNTRLKLELEVTRTQFANTSNYLKKETYGVKEIKTIID